MKSNEAAGADPHFFEVVKRGARATTPRTVKATFVWDPPSANARRAEALFFEDPDTAKPNDELLDVIAQFKKQVAELADIMAGVFPEVRSLDDDETLTYLHLTVSMNRHVVRRPTVPMYLDGVLSDMAFTPGDVPMLGDHYIPTCTIASFPPSAYPGILDDLNQLPLEYRWVTRFIFLDKQEAESELQKYRKGWFQKQKGFLTLLKEQAMKQESAFVDGSAIAKSVDADAALTLLGEDAIAFGYFTATITVWDEDLESARRKVQTVKQVIQGRGFAVKDETLNSRDAWLGSAPHLDVGRNAFGKLGSTGELERQVSRQFEKAIRQVKSPRWGRRPRPRRAIALLRTQTSDWPYAVVLVVCLEPDRASFRLTTAVRVLTSPCT